MEAIAVYDAKGGDPRNVVPKFDKDGKHSAGLTTVGKYKLHHSGKHVSSSWHLSRIPWGVPIKEFPANRDVLYEYPPGHWHSVRKKVLGSGPAAEKHDVIAELLKIYEIIASDGPAKGKLPGTWVFNDFGHITWYMVEASSTHEALHSPPKIHNEFIHTTQPNEYQTAHHKPVVLEYSHGCIHVKPRDIDDLAASGYLKAGNWFVVHKYGEHPVVKLNPSASTKLFRYQLHFFPGLEKIVVYAY